MTAIEYNTNKNPADKHVAALDGLRGVAILMVLMVHAVAGWAGALSIKQDVSDVEQSFHMSRLLESIARNGGNGVQLFFVLSAFTLTISLITKPFHINQYLLKRICRIGPGYWLALIYYMAYAGFTPRVWAPYGITTQDVVIAGIFGSAWQGQAALAVVPGGWSVSCELTFYLLLVPLLIILKRSLRRAIIITILSTIVVLAHISYLRTIGANDFGSFVNPIHQLPVFLLGITAAFVRLKISNTRHYWFGPVLIFIAVFLLPFIKFPSSYLVFSILIAIAVVFISMQQRSVFSNNLIVYVGKISYSMYLVHFALLNPCFVVSQFVFPDLGDKCFLLHLTLISIGSITLAAVTYRFVETPFIKFANSYGRRKVSNSSSMSRPTT